MEGPNIFFRVSKPLKDSWKTYCHETGIKENEAGTRLVEFFLALPPEVRAAALRQVPITKAMAPVILKAIEGMAEKPPRRKK